MKLTLVPIKKVIFKSSLNPEEFIEKLSCCINKPEKGLMKKIGAFNSPFEGYINENSFVMEGLINKFHYIMEGNVSNDDNGSSIVMNLKMFRTVSTMTITVTLCLLIPFVISIFHTIYRGQIPNIKATLFVFSITIFLYIIQRLRLEMATGWTLDFFNKNLKE